MQTRQSTFSLTRLLTVILLLSLLATLLILPACKKSFTRDEEFVDLGKIEELLQPLQHLPQSSALVTLDEGGWAAMSTRCTHEGCGLSLHEGNLLCSCCRSVYDLNGKVLKGPTSKDLPWMEITFENGHLYAHPKKVVDQKYRFTNPKITESIKKLLSTVKEFGTHKPREIPAVLLGQEQDIPGPMFVEPHEDAELEAEFDKLKTKDKN